VLQFRQSDTEATLRLTLNERVTINDPYYLFVFTHVTTKEVVKFSKSESQDESLFPDRINEFTIDASTVFANKPVGEWHYKVYENITSGTDEATAGVILEHGKLFLLRETDFSYTKYNQAQSYTVYGGS